MTDARIREVCPFCGRTDALEAASSGRWGHFVRCNRCHAAGPNAGSRQGAIDKWNERPEPVQGRLI